MPARHPSLEDRFDPAVRIVEHEPGWAARAARELDRIAAAIGDLAVRLEHIGSTAVPGLAAKPIVDLQLSVVSLEPRERHVKPLERLGYLFAFDPGLPDRRFFALPHARPRKFHLHVCASGSHEERRHLAVRDFLRAHGDEAAAYEQRKRAIAAEHPEDRLAYIAGKEAYVSAPWSGGRWRGRPVVRERRTSRIERRLGSG